MDTYIKELKEKGYTIIPNILAKEEIVLAKELFFKWKNSVPDFDKILTSTPHGIFKFHEVAHQEFAWFIRTRPQVIDIFKKIWETEELVVSFDGSCYMPKDFHRKDKTWTHADQGPKNPELQCYQSFVSLTDNCERTLVVYENSNNLFESYFKEKNNTSSKNWQLIDLNYLEKIKDSKRILKVNAGDLVLWDSRTFHQNQYGDPTVEEERIVQYICYLPKSHPKNTAAQRAKRQKYFLERRTTSHWPCPIKVNGLQPQTYGDRSLLIDYDLLVKPDLEKYMETIKTLI